MYAVPRCSVPRCSFAKQFCGCLPIILSVYPAVEQMSELIGAPARLLTIFFVAVLTCGATAQANTEPGRYDQLGWPEWVNVAKPPVVETGLSEADAIVRRARNQMFNTRGAQPLRPHYVGDKSAPSGGGFDFAVTRGPVPIQTSDLVVIGMVSNFQPFLSTDKSMVYSELSLSPTDVLKDNTHLVTPSVPITILQRGGTLRLPDQEVLNSVPYGGSNPIRIATRYLLFLKYQKAQQAFTVIRAWDLSGAKPLEMDDDGHPYVGRTQSLEDILTSEENLVAYVKSRLTPVGATGGQPGDTIPKPASLASGQPNVRKEDLPS